MGLYCDIIKISDEEILKCHSVKNRQEELYDFLQTRDRADYLELDKAWHGIYFIMTRYSASSKSGFLLHGGEAIQDFTWEDSYGVDVQDMRSFTSAEVLDIHKITSSLTESKFRALYNPKLMNNMDIYPHMWEKRQPGILLARLFHYSVPQNYIYSYFSLLNKFISEAAGAQKGIVIKYHQ
jgi:hypothetical protein